MLSKGSMAFDCSAPILHKFAAFWPGPFPRMKSSAGSFGRCIGWPYPSLQRQCGPFALEPFYELDMNCERQRHIGRDRRTPMTARQCLPCPSQDSRSASQISLLDQTCHGSNHPAHSYGRRRLDSQGPGKVSMHTQGLSAQKSGRQDSQTDRVRTATEKHTTKLDKACFSLVFFCLPFFWYFPWSKLQPF